MKKEEKTKKEKVKYYDDGSTIADMSGVGKVNKIPSYSKPRGYKVSEKEKLKTFFSAMKMMVGPCIIALGVIALIYVFLMIISGNFF